MNEHEARVFKALDEATEAINKVGDLVFPALTWVWVWDVILDLDPIVPSEVVLVKLMKDIDTLGLDMNYGPEVIYETIREWLIKNEFILDEDKEEEEEGE